MRKVQNRKPLWRRACALACAAALTCSMVPAAAFAAEVQTTGTTSLGGTLKYLQLSVDAPANIVFERTVDGKTAGYDIEDPAGWGNVLTAPVQFTNNSDAAVYLAGADVLQKEGAKVSDVFTSLLPSGGGTVGNNANPFLSLQATAGGDSATCRTLNPANATTAMDFSATWVSTFTIAERASANAGTKATFTLSLNKAAAQLKSGIAVSADDPVTKFCAMTWTFAMVPDFYLQVANKPVSSTLSASYQASDKNYYADYDARSAILSKYAGTVWNLNQVKQHSSQIAQDTAQTGELSKLYRALATSLAPEGDYECRVKYTQADKAEYWPVRLIGVNQDVAATSEDGYAKGSLVGLTFQFRDLIDKSAFNPDAATNAGGWGKAPLRSKLQAGGTYYEKMAIKGSLVAVKKAYGPTWSDTTANVLLTGDEIDGAADGGDKMFLPSVYELIGQNIASYTDGKAWIGREGAGSSHDQQYLLYQNRGLAINNGGNAPWLRKTFVRDDKLCRVETLGGGDTAVNNIAWWCRSVHTLDGSAFRKVDGYGNPGGSSVSNDASRGVCPCFCL